MLLPLADDCADTVAATTSYNSYLILAFQAIATALATGTYTCTLTVSGKSGADVKAVVQNLKQLGYIVMQSTTTLTIRWDCPIPTQLNA